MFRLTYIYAIPPFLSLDPNAHLTFWIQFGLQVIRPINASIWFGNLRLQWPRSVIGLIMNHEPGPPYVWNTIGGVLKPFVLPIPYSA